MSALSDSRQPRPALQTAVRYALQQSLIAREIEVGGLFDAAVRAL
jgi:hypothetical protein